MLFGLYADFTFTLVNQLAMVMQLNALGNQAAVSKPGRQSGEMVSLLDSTSAGRGTKLCSWARHFTLIVPLHVHDKFNAKSYPNDSNLIK